MNFFRKFSTQISPNSASLPSFRPTFAKQPRFLHATPLIMQGERYSQEFPEPNQSSFPDMGFEGEVEVGSSSLSRNPGKTAPPSLANNNERFLPQGISHLAFDASIQDGRQGMDNFLNNSYRNQNFLNAGHNDASFTSVWPEQTFTPTAHMELGPGCEAYWDANWLTTQPFPTGAYAAIPNANVINIAFPALYDVKATAAAAMAAPTPAIAQVAMHHCTGCNKSFKRKSCRDRHEQVHRTTQVVHNCTIAGCAARYKRADKLTEHMWKKHADLGYVKAW